MMIIGWRNFLIGAIAAVCLVAGSDFASASGNPKSPVPNVLDRLQPGLWHLKIYGEQTDQQICIDGGKKLIQIRHQGENCAQFVIEDAATVTTIQYTCRSSGYGRTRIRFEQATLAQIDTQGILRGLPFDDKIEARRIGPCQR